MAPRACISFYGVYSFDDEDFKRFWKKVIERKPDAQEDPTMYDHASPTYWITKR